MKQVGPGQIDSVPRNHTPVAWRSCTAGVLLLLPSADGDNPAPRLDCAGVIQSYHHGRWGRTKARLKPGKGPPDPTK